MKHETGCDCIDLPAERLPCDDYVFCSCGWPPCEDPYEHCNTCVHLKVCHAPIDSKESA